MLCLIILIHGQQSAARMYLTRMKRTVQITGLVIALLYGLSIVWLYVRQPRSFQELKTQVAVETNSYQIKRENFDQGLTQFNAGQYKVAIEQFELADPAQSDPTTQFYIAYSYYLLGRGNLFDDDEMFRKGLAAIDRCIQRAPNNIYEIDRADFEVRNASALRQRFRSGLDVSPSDFNPLNWFKK
jgi:tetratricopeptide (TPR) repeat protein